MLSNKEIVCPDNLLNTAKKKKNVTAGIVNAGKPLPMHSALEAVKKNLIIFQIVQYKNSSISINPHSKNISRSKRKSKKSYLHRRRRRRHD